MSSNPNKMQNSTYKREERKSSLFEMMEKGGFYTTIKPNIGARMSIMPNNLMGPRDKGLSQGVLSNF